MCPTNSTRLYSISAAPLLGETLVYGRLTRAGGHVPRDRDVPGHEGLGARPCLGRIQLDVCLPLPRRRHLLDPGPHPAGRRPPTPTSAQDMLAGSGDATLNNSQERSQPDSNLRHPVSNLLRTRHDHTASPTGSLWLAPRGRFFPRFWRLRGGEGGWWQVVW